MKFRRLWELAVCWALVGSASAVAQGTIPVFTGEPTTLPDGSIRQQAVWEARVRLIEELAEAAGLRISITPLPWRRAQASAEQGAGLIWGLSRTAERTENFVFSEPILQQPVWVVGRADSGWTFRSVADLRGKSISIPSGVHFAGEFELARDKQFVVEQRSTSLPSRLQMLSRGRVDAVAFGTLRQTRRAAQSYIDCYQGRTGELLVAPAPLTQEALHLAAAKNSEMAALLPRINAGLAELKRRGRLQALINAFSNAPLTHCSD